MNTTLKTLGRRLRLGVLGGGPGSFIGEVHRIAARMDDHYEVVAGVLSRDAERSRAAAVAIGIAPERAYADHAGLIAGEAARPDGIDVLAIMTPNGLHHAAARDALAHDLDGERILAACGADLPQLRKDLDKYLNEQVEQFSRGQQKEPEQTLAFRRVLQTAVLHVQSAGRQEVQSGDVLAATLQQNKSYAAQLLAAQGVTRLDVLEYITHGISKVPPAHSPSGSSAAV